MALVGVGAGDLPRPLARRLARLVAASADLLVVRDEESARLLVDAGVPAPLWVGADPAWTLLREQPPDLTLRRDHVVVALSHLAGGRELPAQLAQALAPVADAGLRVHLQPWQIARAGGRPGGDDLDLARRVAARLGGAAEVVPCPSDLHAARADMSGARVVVGLRFHALLAAASVGVPFVALAHEAKLAGLARRLGQPAVATLDGQLADAVLAQADAEAAPSAVVARQIAAADEGFRLLRLLLGRGVGGADRPAAGDPSARPALEPALDMDTTPLSLEPAPWLF